MVGSKINIYMRSMFGHATLLYYTVNVDIFACINFRAFLKIGNFAQINIRVFFFLPLCCIIKNIFTMYIFSRRFDKRK